MLLSSSYSRVPPQGPLYQKLMALRPAMAQAAQAVYDAWEQDEEGFDEDYGGGGICHDVADAVLGVVFDQAPELNGGTVSATCGEQHVWAIVHLGDEGYEIDIHPSVYETGSGYTWEKIPDVEIGPDDISISWIHPDEAQQAIEYDQ